MGKSARTIGASANLYKAISKYNFFSCEPFILNKVLLNFGYTLTYLYYNHENIENNITLFGHRRDTIKNSSQLKKATPIKR